MWGTDGVRVFSPTAGADLHRRRRRRVCRLACLPATLRRPAADLRLPGVWPTAVGAARGLVKPIRSQYCRPSPSRSSSGASSRPTPSSPSQERSVASGRTLKEQPGNAIAAAGRRPRAMPSAVRLPEPRSSSSGMALPISISPPRETNLCPRNRVRYDRPPLVTAPSESANYSPPAWRQPRGRTPLDTWLNRSVQGGPGHDRWKKVAAVVNGRAWPTFSPCRAGRPAGTRASGAQA